MDWIIPICSFFTQSRDQQAIGRDHYFWVARLHREDECVIIESACNSGEFERALHHPKRRVAVAIHDAIGERTMVRSDAHRDPTFFAKFHQRRKTLPNS